MTDRTISPSVISTAADVIRIDSIPELLDILNYPAAGHPLIAVIDLSLLAPLPIGNLMPFIPGYYCISMKDHGAGKYGRQSYDFNSGSMMFAAPEQLIVLDPEDESLREEGWMLCFHPDLIRNSNLARKIDSYSFFRYSTSEALHMSEQEKITIMRIADSIGCEIRQNIDQFTQDIIISNLEVLLNYARRFYCRQFITRNAVHSDLVLKFEQAVSQTIQPNPQGQVSLPTVRSIADAIGYSPSYLSDVLKKETGMTAQEHLQVHVICIAKNLLLNTSQSVSEIAYALGFEYPNHFIKFFRSKTGSTPGRFRKQEL